MILTWLWNLIWEHFWHIIYWKESFRHSYNTACCHEIIFKVKLLKSRPLIALWGNNLYKALFLLLVAPSTVNNVYRPPPVREPDCGTHLPARSPCNVSTKSVPLGSLQSDTGSPEHLGGQPGRLQLNLFLLRKLVGWKEYEMPWRYDISKR